jgi:hypothetical protein
MRRTWNAPKANEPRWHLISAKSLDCAHGRLRAFAPRFEVNFRAKGRIDSAVAL